MKWLEKVLNTASGSTLPNVAAAGKKDAGSSQSWLQKLNDTQEPVREDGGDKFFGSENFGNICYFNSILQCLYYSIPFRELVLNYPNRSPIQTILKDPDGRPRTQLTAMAEPNGHLPLPKPKPTPNQTSARSAGIPTAPAKPEDKDSPEYKKKQALLQGPMLTVDYDNSAAYGMEPSLFTCLKDMFESIVAHSSRTGVVSPRLFLKMLQDQNEMFRGAMHQDAHEFLRVLLSDVVENVDAHTKKLEEEEVGANGSISKTPRFDIEEVKAMSSRLQDLFKGSMVSETKCLTCENISRVDEAFLDLSVELGAHYSVTSCLRKFSEEEILCEREKFFCDNCKGPQEAEKRMRVKRLPKLLALHLKRFQLTEDYTRLQKLFHKVVYPYHLRLFNTTEDVEDSDRLYELYAVVVHIGNGPYHGHYISIIKTPDRGWLLFDDEHVESVDKSYVRHFFGAQTGMACAYVFFYQETTFEKVQQEQATEGLNAAAAAAAAAESAVNTAARNKEGTGLGLVTKANGIPVQSSAQPNVLVNEENDPLAIHKLASLAQSHTAPTPTLSSTTHGNNKSSSSSPFPGLSLPVSVFSNDPSNKAAAREEKERKAAEKAAEKAEKEALKAAEKEEKARKKSTEQRNRETAKAQSREIRHSLSLAQRRKTNEGLTTPELGNNAADGSEAYPHVNGTTTNGIGHIQGQTIPPMVGTSSTAMKAATSVPLVNSLATNAAIAAVASSAGPTSDPASNHEYPSSHVAQHQASGSFSVGTNPASKRTGMSARSMSMRRSKFWSAGLGGRKESKESKDGRESSTNITATKVKPGTLKDSGAVAAARAAVGDDVAVSDSDSGEGRSSIDGEGAKEKEKEKKTARAGSESHVDKPLPPLPGASGAIGIKKRAFSIRKKASALLS